MSACGIRQPENYHNYSPKIAIHKQTDDTNSIQQINTGRPTRKDEPNYGMMKLPPKPQVNPTNNINYKLPPRPVHLGIHQNQPSNKSFDHDTNQQR